MTKTTTTAKYNAEEFTESLTGYEEIGITTAFGKSMTDLEDTMGVRAMAFVHHKRLGLSHDDAKDAALSMTLGEVMAMFNTDAEPVPDDPASESGKDESSPATAPTTRPPSAS